MLLTCINAIGIFSCIGQEFMLSSISTVDIRPVSNQADWDLLMFLLIFNKHYIYYEPILDFMQLEVCPPVTLTCFTGGLMKMGCFCCCTF